MRCAVLMLAGLLAACQTPGYDYAGRIAPEYPQALDYTDVVAGRFEGPASDIARREFERLIASVAFDGRPWFVVQDPERPRGLYEGDVSVTGYRGEIRYMRESECVEYDGLFDCERRGIVEARCVKAIVDVTVDVRLIDYATGRTVFVAPKGGTAEREDCYDIAEYPDTDQSTGQHGPTEYETYSPYDAPYQLIADAVPPAIREFRTVIAPYAATRRAEIVTRALVGEEAGDARFKAAVDATRRGEITGACAQWQQLAAAYPKAPAIQHNWGACAEASGDLAMAQAQYALAAELARGIPLIRDKDAAAIFDSLERVSRGRFEDRMIDDAKAAAGH